MLRIAIADDSRSMRLVLTKMLNRLGHQVVCDAADGQELVTTCESTDVDLAVVDLDMPVMDGLAAAEEIATAMQIPVILISAHDDLQYVDPRTEPVSSCISKPISIDELQQAIHKALQG